MNGPAPFFANGPLRLPPRPNSFKRRNSWTLSEPSRSVSSRRKALPASPAEGFLGRVRRGPFVSSSRNSSSESLPSRSVSPKENARSGSGRCGCWALAATRATKKSKPAEQSARRIAAAPASCRLSFPRLTTESFDSSAEGVKGGPYAGRTSGRGVPCDALVCSHGCRFPRSATCPSSW